jgi:hypothetical protein
VDDQVIKLTFRTDTTAVNQSRDAVKGLHAATHELTESSRNLGRATLESGRILQDFSQGGVAGILNNIEGLTSALGGGPGLAGIMTAVGLAAYFAAPAIRELFGEARNNPIPDNINSLKGMEDRLKVVTKQLGELREQQKLTNTELETYNRLTKEEAELTAKANAEKARKAELDKLDRSVTDEQAARGAAFTDATEGRSAGMREGLVKALQSEQAARVNEYAALAAKKLKEALEDPNVSQAQYDAMAAKFGDEIETMKQARPEDDARIAADLQTRAAKGDQSAIDRIKQLASRGGNAELQRVMTAYQDPRETAAYDADAAKFDEDMKARAEARKARDAKAKTAAEAKSRVELDWWAAQSDAVAAEEEQKSEDKRKAKEAAAAAERARKADAKPFDDLAQDVAKRAMDLEAQGLSTDMAMMMAFQEIVAAQQALGVRQAAAEAYARQLMGDAARLRTWLGRGGR